MWQAPNYHYFWDGCSELEPRFVVEQTIREYNAVS